MPLVWQNIIVIGLVLACVAFVAFQAFKTLTLRRGKLGACCAKGCDADQAKPRTAESVQFLPVEMLGRKR